MCINPSASRDCVLNCIGCCQRCCSCGFASGSREEVPWLGKKLARVVQAIFAIALFILEFIWATLEVIFHIAEFYMPMIYLFIALVLSYFLFLFFPIVIEFIVNVLMPVLLIILDIFCFVWWLLITLYRIVSLIWNIFVPFIGMIIYFIVTLVAQIFQIVFEVIGDIIEDIFMGLMQILMPIIGTLLNIIMFFIQLGLEVMMVLMDVIMTILDPIFEIIGVLAEIVGWLVGALFQAIEPILGLITEFFSWMGMSGVAFGSGRKLLSLDDDPGVRFGSGANGFGPGSQEWQYYDTPLEKGIQNAVNVMNSIGGPKTYKDLLSSTRSLRERSSRYRKENEGRSVYKPDPAHIEDMLSAGKHNNVGPKHHFKPVTSKDVTWLVNVLAGPYHPLGKIPNSATKERRMLRDVGDARGKARETGKKSRRDTFDTAPRTQNSSAENRDYDDDDDLLFSHADMISDYNRRMARVRPRLKLAWDRILDAFVSTYLSHASGHAHRDHVLKHVETAKNVTGIRGWKDVEKHLRQFREDYLVHDSYEDFMLSISPEGTAWHEFLKRYDTEADRRKFWRHYHNSTNEDDPDWTEDEGFTGNFSTGRTLKAQQGQEFANMASTDCFSEPRNPLCLPEVNRTIGDFCPGRPCLPWNLTGDICPGYIKTKCVWCPAQFYNAWKVLGYMLSIIRSIVMIFSVLKLIVPGVSWLFKILDLLAPDQKITVQGVLCMIMHTYSVLMVMATFFYGYIFIWPYLVAIYNCIKIYRQMLEENLASDAADLAAHQDSVWVDRVLRREIQRESLRRGDWGFEYDNMGPVPKANAPVYTKLKEEYEELDNEYGEMRKDDRDYDSMSQEILMERLKQFDSENKALENRNPMSLNPFAAPLLTSQRIGFSIERVPVSQQEIREFEQATLKNMRHVRRMLRRVFCISPEDILNDLQVRKYSFSAEKYEREERNHASGIGVDAAHMRSWRSSFLDALADR